jgi:gluconolactonase
MSETGWQPSLLYPDPAVITLDPRFERIRPPFNASVERLYTGCRWAEGPVWFGDGRFVLWSDIPNNRILKWEEETGAVSVFRKPSNNSNGNTRDRQGRLVTCEHGARQVTRTEHDGTITVLCNRYDRKPLNSPNDVVVKSDGSIWFTDPTYGIDDDIFGRRATSEIGAQYVYRVDPSGAIAVVADDFVQPNGLAFSPDEKRIYIVDTGKTHKKDMASFHMRVFDLAPDGKLKNGRIFAECRPGAFDGFRVDEAENIWTSAGDGVHCIHRDGTLLGKIKMPEGPANLTFGAPGLNRLYIAAKTSLYSVDVRARGAKTF